MRRSRKVRDRTDQCLSEKGRRNYNQRQMLTSFPSGEVGDITGQLI